MSCRPHPPHPTHMENRHKPETSLSENPAFGLMQQAQKEVKEEKADLHISGDAGAEDGKLFFCGLVIRPVETGSGSEIAHTHEKKTKKKMSTKPLQD